MNLTELLPEALYNLIGGYIFISIYRFASYKKTIDDVEHLLMASLTFGFIIQEICKCKFLNIIVVDSVNGLDTKNLFKYLCLCVIGAFILAKLRLLISRFKFTSGWLKKLNINRTSNTNVWLDIFPPYEGSIWVKLSDTTNGVYYIGKCVLYEENEHCPLIVLSEYQKVNKDGQILVSSVGSPKRKIILNSANFSSIERVE